MPCCEKMQVLKQNLTQNNTNMPPCEYFILGFITNIVKSKEQKYIAMILRQHYSADE